MQQRRSSCLPCRTRKVKCDKKEPCTRCAKTDKNNCIYPLQGTLGRPPKNAVFHGKTKYRNTHQLAIREFIFEHGGNNKKINNMVSTSTVAARFFVDNEWWVLSKEALQEYPFLRTYFESLHMFYIQRGLAIRKRFSHVSYRLPERPRLKFNSLQYISTWWTTLAVNTLLRRCSRLHLKTFTVPSLALYMFQMTDKDYGFSTTNDYLASLYSTPPPLMIPTITLSDSNPLKSLPPEQAMNLINDFYRVYPLSIHINKTQLINDYWSDTANPLLLSVIYGVAQSLSRVLQGVPMYLWECSTQTNRNPFLTYAFTLIENLPAKPSASDYQATVILSLFEVIWGYPKIGMSLLATSYLMGTQLGLWDNTFKAANPIEKELVNMSSWSAFQATTHGCMEMGSSIMDSLVANNRSFPPMNIYESQSCQHDMLHNNIDDLERTASRIECAYTNAVVVHFSGILYACLPKPYFNIFGLRTEESTFEGSEFLTILRSIDNVETRLQTVLDDFDRFIQQHRHLWTDLQLYVIETSYHLYRVHFHFLHPTLTCGKRKYQEDLIPMPVLDDDDDDNDNSNKSKDRCFMVDPTDPAIAARLQQVLGDVIVMVDNYDALLAMNHTTATIITPTMDQASTSSLPHELMVTVFETCAQLLILSFQAHPAQQIRECMIKLLTASKKHDIYHPPTASLKNVRQQLKLFLKNHHPTTVPSKSKYILSRQPHQQLQRQQQHHRHHHGDSMQRTFNTDVPGLLFLQPPDVIQQQQRSHLEELPTGSLYLPIGSSSNISPSTTSENHQLEGCDNACALTVAATPGSSYLPSTIRQGSGQQGHGPGYGLLGWEDTVYFWNEMLNDPLYQSGDTFTFLEQQQ
ncbi:uncharacterized protein BX664DRAFT_384635 [Halteromyces radiatus]|uniref:uncharacterized protein n=1 Tax=Halteromyces radiatus TaxID=101107 RepID=UPI002220054C|nr:uncharacterized protein BX664DRAFT_384635 [Halteromyces radiatus]KAI8093163.1 hypothetical protein BX664DRAFT_384635 [Halteromyces radiatus]